MLYNSLYIFAVVGVLLLICSGFIKDARVAKALVFIGGIVLLLSLVLLGGCRVILSGMRIE